MTRAEDTLNEEQRGRRAEAWRLVAEAGRHWDAGRFHETEGPYLRALALLEEVWGGEHPETAVALHNLAGLRSAQERYEEAETLYARAARIYAEAFGPDDPRAAGEYYWLGQCLFREGKYEEAERAYLDALARLERALGPDDASLAEPLLRLGHLRYYVGRYAEAEAPFARALRLRERAHGPGDPLTARALMRLADLYHHGAGVEGDAEHFYRRAVRIVERVQAGTKYHAECVYRLALFLAERGRAEEAGPLFERALELVAAAPDPQEWDARWMRGGYADFLRAAGRGEEAAAVEAQTSGADAYEDALRAGIKRREATHGPDHPLTAEALYRLANVLRFDGRDEEAAQLYRRARAVWEGAGGRVRAACCLNMLAEISRHAGRLAESEAQLDEADRLLEGHNDDSEAARQRGRALENRAWLEAARGRHDAAERFYLRAVAQYESCLDESSFAFVEALYRLAIFYSDAGRHAESEAVLLRLIPLAEGSGELDALETSDFHEHLARVLRAQGRDEEAARAEARAAELRGTNE